MDTANVWANSYTLEFKPGFWTVGTHSYEIQFTDQNGSSIFSNQFFVDNNTPVIKSQVLLRLFGLRSEQGPVTTINPAQDTAAVVFNIYTDENDNPLSRQQAEDARAQITVQLRRDGGSWETMNSGALKNERPIQNPSRFKRSWGSSF